MYSSGTGSGVGKLLIFHVALPVLFLAPEVIDLGFMFLRWDYLLIGTYVLAAFQKNISRALISPVRFEYGYWPVLALFILFSIFQLWAARNSGELLAALKYASWPIKMIFWAIGIRVIYSALRCKPSDFYFIISTIATIVFAMQLLELGVPSFRGLIFEYYPVAASDRLFELGYRARGPFSGYDLASMFFAVAGIVINELGREMPRTKRLWTFTVLMVCLVGALIAARTGFILLVGYLLVTNVLLSGSARRRAILLLLPIAMLLLLNGTTISHAEDDGLLSRYLEIVAAVREGDIMRISSVSGTFYMNAILELQNWNVLWGSGLETGTTADQLYFKYLFMYGVVGLSVWIIVHVIIMRLITINASRPGAYSGYCKAAFAVGIIVAIAHFKGGNYFFASRLGEIITALILLTFARERVSTQYVGK